MKIATFIVTRSKSCHVKTMHSVLRFNLRCMERQGVENEIVFLDEDPYRRSETIHKYLRTHDRIFFIDFGTSVDDNSLNKVLDTNEGVGVLVFPGVKEGVDWDMFKEKVKNKSSEPVHQLGLHFDTDVSTKIEDDIYRVKSTTARTWVLMCKPVLRALKDKRTGNVKIPPKLDTMFEKFKENKVNIVAYTAANITYVYTHECVGNIINSAGIKVS